MTEYERWLGTELDDPDLTEELNQIKGNVDEINDRFYRNLAFETGGLRGVIGAGTNRMNVYTVRKATQGLANYLKNTAEQPLQLHMTAVSNPTFLQSRARRCLRPTELRHIFIRGFPQPRPFPMRFVI